MGRTLSFRDILGRLKDKASLSKAALLFASSLRLAVLRATTHSPPSPPHPRRISSLLLLGQTSRATASPIISALMDRLHCTSNSVVALKCLLIIHHIIKRGTFILQDQLSIFPATGGRNYLKLSAFRDSAAWDLSRCVRWYARYLETSLSTSRILGYFLCSNSSCSAIKENQESKIASFLNSDIIKEIDALALLVQEICKLPDSIPPDGELLVKEIVGLVVNDYLSSVNEILIRLGEVNERLGCLSFTDSLELVCALKRLLGCKERLSAIYSVEKPTIEMMWSSIERLKENIQRSQVYRGEERLLILGRRETPSESARFDGRVLVRNRADSVPFHSGRF